MGAIKRHHRGHRVSAHVILLFLLIGTQAAAQTITVTGTVSTTAAEVRYASVTFEETADPQNAVSGLTDSTGRYELGLLLTPVESDEPLPASFALGQNYPNPFSSLTAIPYELNAASDVRVTIHDLLGRVVRTLPGGGQPVGTHTVFWDGRDDRGHRVANGLYFFSLHARGESRTRKMLMAGGAAGYVSGQPSPSFAARPEAARFSHRHKGTSFTVRIKNSTDTSPAIVPLLVEDVVIGGDTTLGFTVEREVAVPVATVHLDSLQQEIRGFGGANILPWRPDMTPDQIQKAFGTGPGEIGFTILRLRIPYRNNVGEFSAQVPTAKLAQSYGAIVIASPWTPPPSMKTNNNIVGGELKEDSYGAYAAHLKSFADYMANQGAPLYAVSIQNEPDARVNYESCDWDATQLLNFTKNNAGAIGTRVMMPESMNFTRYLSDPTLNDSAAAANIEIIAGHIYGGGLTPYPLAVEKGKEFWMTEHLDLDTTWTGVLGTGTEIHNCMVAGMQAYVWWYTVRFYGPIAENGSVSKRGYVMSQYARFVRPGFYRTGCTPVAPRRNVLVTSYRDGASSRVVIVALNRNTVAAEQIFSIPGGSAASYVSYTTSQSKDCMPGEILAVVNGMFFATLDPSSITTFVSE